MPKATVGGGPSHAADIKPNDEPAAVTLPAAPASAEPVVELGGTAYRLEIKGEIEVTSPDDPASSSEAEQPSEQPEGDASSNEGEGAAEEPSEGEQLESGEPPADPVKATTKGRKAR